MRLVEERENKAGKQIEGIVSITDMCLGKLEIPFYNGNNVVNQ